MLPDHARRGVRHDTEHPAPGDVQQSSAGVPGLNARASTECARRQLRRQDGLCAQRCVQLSGASHQWGSELYPQCGEALVVPLQGGPPDGRRCCSSSAEGEVKAKEWRYFEPVEHATEILGPGELHML